MEKIVELGFLFDFYGALLNDHQRQVYEQYIYDNLSLSEIALEHNISRQAAHDLIRRCDKLLSEYENKLHLVEKFICIKEDVSQIEQLSDSDEIRELAHKILEQL